MSVYPLGGRLLRLATTLTALGLYALWLRPQMLTWGATRDEITHTYPGDELVADPDGGATMATFLPTPPERVWPWLVQMGGGRAGWYSWDWLDNNGEPSADRVVPDWQDLEVGRRLKGPTNWWIVAALEPNRTLVLQSSYGLLTARSFDPQFGVPPRVYIEGIWGLPDRGRQGAGRSSRGRIAAL